MAAWLKNHASLVCTIGTNHDPGFSMDFASDNVVGASAPIIEAVAEAARAGADTPYGGDRWTLSAVKRLEEVFERKLDVSFVTTGTAANALALASMTPPWGGVLCHTMAHVNEDECGAPEFFTAGAKLIGLDGPGGKIAPDTLRAALKRLPKGVVRQVQAAALTLTQATECGTVYTPDEIAALTQVAHDADLGTHMDGARFGNALVTLGCTPAEMTWKAGIDILSFGATKNGALACEAIVVFNPDRVNGLAFQRKRAGHTISKGRLLGAQMDAYLRDDHWLDLARRANDATARLEAGLMALPGVRMPWQRQANELFAILPRAMHDRLQAAGAHYYEWDGVILHRDEHPGPNEVFARLICSFETTAEQINSFLAVAAQQAQ